MFSRKKILVVEDNMLNRSLLCQILSEDYDVVEAENGQEALDILKQYGERCLPIRKHRGAREKRYSFGYAVFLILALMK